MTTPVIEAEGLSKRYRLGATIRYDTLSESLTEGLSSLFGKKRDKADTDETFWALRDINFSVEQGEVVGIIGRNGAGKSTLLKLLSRITDPTEGTARIRGRVVSLLEVGTGFHPELTGRENIFLNGAILGMTRREMKDKFDEIVDFAEIEKFLDTPVKRYSSGMYVRLAFAVAAHLEPEIIIVDEVLAVGDAKFQKKCLGKMEEVGKSGRTVLFVSHNMGAIHSLTNRCMYLEEGRIIFDGPTEDAVKTYLFDSRLVDDEGVREMDYYRPDYYCKNSGPVKIMDIWVNGAEGRVSSLNMGDRISVSITLKTVTSIHGANMAMTIFNSDGQPVTVLFSWDRGFYLDLEAGRHTVTLDLAGLVLPPGNYTVNAGINQSTETTAWDGIKDYPLFEVVNSGHIVHWLHRQWGCVHVDNVSWNCKSHVQ